LVLLQITQGTSSVSQLELSIIFVSIQAFAYLLVTVIIRIYDSITDPVRKIVHQLSQVNQDLRGDVKNGIESLTKNVDKISSSIKTLNNNVEILNSNMKKLVDLFDKAFGH